MATSFPTNPLSYAHAAALCWRNIAYGPYIQQRLNYYKNEIDTGANPVLVYAHGGGWGSNEKTSTVENTIRVQRLLWAYLIGSTVYGTADVPFDIVSIGWRMHTHTNIAPTPLSTPYEPTSEGTNPGTGPTTFPAYFPSWIDDGQRAVQFVKDNAPRFGCDPDKIVAWGTSAGGGLALAAAFTPSRRFLPSTTASAYRFGSTSTSSVRGVLNWYGEIDFNPWYLDCSLLSPAFGLVENSPSQQRADMERLLLYPASDGTYPQDSQLRQLCKAISPRHLILERRGQFAGVKIRSHYWIAEQTNEPLSWLGYASIPPYGATGHDWRQFADLAAACAASGIAHEGSVLDHGNHGGDVQLMWEASLAPTYAWLRSTVGL